MEKKNAKKMETHMEMMENMMERMEDCEDLV